MSKIIIETKREGYSTSQVYDTITVAELIDILSGLDPDAKVYTSHDGGYTYGGITEESINEH